MLQFIRIKNLALLEEVSIEFEAGFTAVTGETGAGKSILLGALGLLSGARTDKSLIRQGADFCEVEGGLYFPDEGKVNSLLEEMGLPPCEEGLLLLKRLIPRDKAPRVMVNGSHATIANLQEIGDSWIDFHGPGEPRRLLKTECQIELLDLYGQHGSLVETYTEAYRGWRQKLAEIEGLKNETQLSQDQIDFLKNQIAEIDHLELTEESVEELERDFNRIDRGRELIELAGGIGEGLSGDEGVLPKLEPLDRMGAELEEIDPETASLAERLSSLVVELEDLGREFSGLAEGLDFDEGMIQSIQERMNLWLELKRKHGGGVESVLETREVMARKVESQGDIEGTLERLNSELVAAEATARKVAAKLRKGREKAGKNLTGKAAEIIKDLGFEKAGLEVKMIEEASLSPHGDARPELLFSPNVGEPLMPLVKIASSGELARVMLALKTVLAEVDDIPVLVFDEVDANVGGEIGMVVGAKMAEIARKHQVFCVTHLPQVAALAGQHFVVEKNQSGSRAVVTIDSIHGEQDQRIGELARMLGDRNAKSAIAHASELLSSC